MKPASVKEIKQLPVEDYKTIRGALQTGDIVFCGGNYLFSRIIQRFTKSMWSHVGVIYRDEQLNRVLILESEKLYGVRLTPLSKYIKDYHGKNKPYKGRMVVGALNEPFNEQDLKNGICFGFDALTKPYDNWEILRIATRILFKRGKRADDRKYICSELVFEVFRRANYKFQYNNSLISPDDIWRDANINMKMRIL
ncbi:MAG: YiiX/YebB-like N1pC/P60 family cysteine hydrolase [Sediminibacterium sp.]|nr:YiiX/YebB-like N1pC/P60 family cysteine hydrolase [Sediminibacterium sp.]